jgi:hypothetical protein
MNANECIWMQMNADECRWTWDPLIVCRLICFDSIPVCRCEEGIFFTSQGTTIIEKIAYVKMISWSARHVIMRVITAASLDAHTCHFALPSQMTFRYWPEKHCLYPQRRTDDDWDSNKAGKHGQYSEIGTMLVECSNNNSYDNCSP